MSEKFPSTEQETDQLTAEETLLLAFKRLQTKAAIASSFGAEDMVLIAMADRLKLAFPVFTLDTDFLFPQTYSLITQAEQRYGIVVERLPSLFTPEEQARVYGDRLWASNPDQCCSLRKVEPLRRKLASLGGWITGIRRDQAPTRAHTRSVEWDEKFGLTKFNPLADWTSEQVWSYIHANQVPYNPLHDQNYPSIGCTHCTRAVKAGDDPRSGRWSDSNKTECGLHIKA
jgi:phosphoadenosine phosphosulfate reductase